MATLTVCDARVFAGIPESVPTARAWVAGHLPGSPAADDVALMVSELFTNAISYSASGHSGGQVTVSIAVSRGHLRVDVIDQGADLEVSKAALCVAAAVATAHRLGAGLKIVRELADESGADGPDKWFTLRINVPAEGGSR